MDSDENRSCGVDLSGKYRFVRNEFGIGNDSCSASCSSVGKRTLQTYKRRKYNKQSSGNNGGSDWRNLVKADGILITETTKDLWENHLDSSALNCSNDVSLLKNVHQSLCGANGCLLGCMDALHPRIVPDKESEACEEDKCASSMQKKMVSKEICDAPKENVESESNVTLNEAHHHVCTEMCWRVFFNIIGSEKFASFCKLLADNFQGLKLENLLILSSIKKKLKDGAYEVSPMLFYEDIQEIWRTIRDSAMELISHANSLSELSRTSFNEQWRSSLECKYEDGKHGEFRDSLRSTLFQDGNSERGVWKTDSAGKLELTEDHRSLYMGCACKKCGQSASENDSLVCDSCEETFHVSCIKPAIKEIPHGSWYCAICTFNGMASPHDNCSVCQRLKTTRTVNACPRNPPDTCYPCKICRGNVGIGEPFRVCDNHDCPYKFYHDRCLPDRLLKSGGSTWYCPSCLCVACQSDGDDDQLVLCDGCDQSYHIYCMNPPRQSVPKSQWFCRFCEPKICQIGSTQIEMFTK